MSFIVTVNALTEMTLIISLTIEYPYYVKARNWLQKKFPQKFVTESFFIIGGVTLIRDHCQISLLILSKFKRINELLIPLKSPENL